VNERMPASAVGAMQKVARCEWSCHISSDVDVTRLVTSSGFGQQRRGCSLFVHFTIAFWLFALNRLASSIPAVADETSGYEYLLRVLGFIVIIVGIIDKNVTTKSLP
jgi:hypothetical protein